ncbi:MAG: flagellin FliC3 [Lachnospiraceae bacterium]|nr:flagellin FliC3 [Lachnospiraceae bacterium]
MRINYNVSAMISNNALRNSDSLLAQSLERLSSGMKINSAKDNPAGLAMAKRMNAQMEGLSVANSNAGDGVSIIETADGAMSEISEMLQRLNELAVKSANGLNSEKDREVIQQEVDQLTEEITRVAEVTEFNGQKLLNGEFSLKGYTDNLDVKVKSYSTEVASKIYNIDNIHVEKEIINGKETGEYMVKIDCLKDDPSDFPQGATASIKDQLVTIEGVNGFEMVLDLTAIDFEANMPLDINNLQVDATGIGAMRLQIGANEGQILGVVIPEISLRDMGIEDLDMTTKESATDAIDRVDGAMQYVSSVRGQLGAYQNRLESTINSLDITSENMTAAYSRIMDVDMAEEMTSYTTYQVLTQAGTSMLAQANERPSQVLQLLQ